MLQESQNLGRLSALSMLLYFFVGPYVNIIMYDNDAVIPSLVVPSLGIGLMALVISAPKRFPLWSMLFLIYSISILVLTV